MRPSVVAAVVRRVVCPTAVALAFGATHAPPVDAQSHVVIRAADVASEDASTWEAKAYLDWVSLQG